MFNNIAVEIKYNEGIKKIADKLFNSLQGYQGDVKELTNEFQASFEKLQFASDFANEIAREDVSFENMLDPNA